MARSPPGGYPATRADASIRPLMRIETFRQRLADLGAKPVHVQRMLRAWLMNQFGLYYVGSLLTLVGYDPNFTVDDRRFWIRNIKG